MTIDEKTKAQDALQSGVHGFAQLALSRNGDKLICVETYDGPHIVVRAAADGAILASHDPQPGGVYNDPNFAPHSDAFAVLAWDADAGSSALWIAGDGPMERRAIIDGAAERLRWSPSGARLAWVSRIDQEAEVSPAVVDAGTVTASQPLLTIDVQGDGLLTIVSPPDRFVYDFDWTSDDQGFVAIVAEGDGDNGWYAADIRHYDRKSGQERIIARPAMQIASARVSPDGRYVAFIGGLMSDVSWPGGDIFLAPFTGGEAVCLTPQFPGSFTSLQWRADTIVATALIDDISRLVVIDFLSGEITQKGGAAVTMSAGRERIALDATGSIIATVVQDFQTAPEIAVSALDRFDPTSRVTHENAHLRSLCTVESIAWENDGLALQGWLLAPLEPVPNALHPLAMIIHGGPAHAFSPTFPTMSFHEGAVQHLLEAGYFVFQPNPRGSYGKGARFARANQRDFGGGDFRDLMTGLDAVLARAPIDPDRLGVVGHSYGGFLAMWTVTQTDRFKAAIAGGGIANWLSYYGQTSIEQWMAPFFGADPYDDPKLYEAMSPIKHIRNVTTPTLLYVGDHDLVCPQSQSMEFWRALKVRGVDTALRIFPGEGHEFCRPDHIRLLAEMQFSWLDQRLRPAKP